MKICYVLPDAYLCGGNRIAAEHCKRLIPFGHETAIALVNYSKSDRKWLKEVAGDKVEIIPFSHIPKWKPNAIVATYFETYYSIKEIEDQIPLTDKYYFVQQIESKFFGDDYNKSRVTVTYGDKSFSIITEALWLKDELKNRYGRDAVYVPNRQEFPSPINSLSKSKRPIVLVEGNAEVHAKGVQDAWSAVKDLDCEKWLLTNSPRSKVRFPFDKIFSRVEWIKALGIINTADILIKPSYFEGSPTPHMEALALGTAIITTASTGVEEYCIDDYNCLVVGIGDVGRMKDRIKLLLADKKLRQKLVKNGLKSSKMLSDWSEPIRTLHSTFAWTERILDGIKNVKPTNK